MREGLKRLKRVENGNSTFPKAPSEGLKRLRDSRVSTFQPSKRWAGRYESRQLPEVVNGWANFRVQTDGEDGPRIYSLAWNGQRLARSRELGRAEYVYPEFLEAVTEWLEAGQP